MRPGHFVRGARAGSIDHLSCRKFKLKDATTHLGSIPRSGALHFRLYLRRRLTEQVTIGLFTHRLGTEKSRDSLRVVSRPDTHIRSLWNKELGGAPPLFQAAPHTPNPPVRGPSSSWKVTWSLRSPAPLRYTSRIIIPCDHTPPQKPKLGSAR